MRFFQGRNTALLRQPRARIVHHRASGTGEREPGEAQPLCGIWRDRFQTIREREREKLVLLHLKGFSSAVSFTYHAMERTTHAGLVLILFPNPAVVPFPMCCPYWPIQSHTSESILRERSTFGAGTSPIRVVFPRLERDKVIGTTSFLFPSHRVLVLSDTDYLPYASLQYQQLQGLCLILL